MKTSDVLKSRHLREMADWLDAEAQQTLAFLDDSGMPRRQVQDLARQQVRPRYAASAALRNAATLLDAVLIPKDGEGGP